MEVIQSLLLFFRSHVPPNKHTEKSVVLTIWLEGKSLKMFR